MSRLTNILGFSVKFFFQPIYTDYTNLTYFDKRSHLNHLFLNCSAKLKHVWLGQPRPPFKMTAVTKSRNFCFITHQNELKF